jgi:hypothetical protein
MARKIGAARVLIIIPIILLSLEPSTQLQLKANLLSAEKSNRENMGIINGEIFDLKNRKRLGTSEMTARLDMSASSATPVSSSTACSKIDSMPLAS